MSAAPLLHLPPAPKSAPTPDYPTRKRHPCADCPTLSPGNQCHCSVCHATFSTVGNFDRHRPSYSGCAHPADVGLIPSTRSPGVWCQPMRGAGPAATRRHPA